MSNLTKRKLEACQVSPIDKIPYEQELQALKQQYEILRDKLEKEHNYRKTTEDLFSQLSSDYAEIEKRDRRWSELSENLLCVEENKWQDLVENGTKEQRIEFLKEREKHCLLGAIDKILKLENLLKECYDGFAKLLVEGEWLQDQELINFLTKIEVELKWAEKNS